MYNVLNSISFVNLYAELATVIRLAVVVVFLFFKSGIQMCTTAISNNTLIEKDHLSDWSPEKHILVRD